MANQNSRSYPKGLREIRYPSNDIVHRFTSKDYTGEIRLNNETGLFEFNPALEGSGNSSSGTSFTTSQLSHGFTVGQPIYHDGTEFKLANASAPETVGVWVVVEVTSADTFRAAQSGRFTISPIGLTPGQFYYTDITDGDITATEPVEYSNPLIFSENATTIHVLPYRPSSSTSGSGGGLINTTDDLPEGVVNLYYTEDRVSANADVVANTAKVTYPTVDSDKLATIEEGAEVNNISDYDSIILTDGSDTNIHYHSDDRDRANHTGTQVASTISDFDSAVASTPAVTINSSKISFIDANIDNNEYVRKNGTWVINSGGDITSTDDLPEGDTNLYFTDLRVTGNAAVLANTAKVSFPEAIADGQYYARRNNTWQVVEVDSPITSVFGRTGAILPVAGDYTPTQVGLGNVLNLEQIPTTEKGVADGVATLDNGGKVPLEQIPLELQGGINVIGFWDASTNTPDLSLLTPDDGDAYQVIVAGSTDLNGITSWALYDLAVYDSTVSGGWFRISSSGQVTSVAGKTGVVTLDTDDITEAVNLYYTEARVNTNTNVVANSAKVSADGSIGTHSDVDVTTTTPLVGDYMKWDGTNWVPDTVSVSGDMLKATYDPLSIEGDVFDYDNFYNVPATSDDILEGTTNLYYTIPERSKLSGIEEGAEVNNMTDADAEELVNGDDSDLHFHTVDRARANHTGTQDATTIDLDTTNFDGNLDSSITQVQLLADAVDNLSVGSGTGANDKVKVNALDAVEGYLFDKIGDARGTLETQVWNQYGTDPYLSITTVYPTGITYKYSTNTTESDPGYTLFKFSASKDFLYVSSKPIKSASSLSAFWNSVGVGSVIRAESTIKNGSFTATVTGELTEFTDGDGWFKIPISLDSQYLSLIVADDYFSVAVLSAGGGGDLTVDELAAINGAASPSSTNVFATKTDLTATEVASAIELTFDNPAGKYQGSIDLSTGDKIFTVATSGNLLGAWVSFNIVADGVHSITLTGFSSILGAQINIPTDGILEAGSYLVGCWYTPDGATFAIPGNSSGGVTPGIPPIISSGTLAADNSYIDFYFSEAVYGDNTATNPVLFTDLQVVFDQSTGTATAMSISSVTKQNGDPVIGGETVIRALITTTGTADGNETVEGKAASATSIYNTAGTAMEATATTGVLSVNDRTAVNPVVQSVISDVTGSQIEMTFDKSMADPSGKHASFEFVFGLYTVTALSVNLKAGDDTTFEFNGLNYTIQADWVEGDASYTAGTVQDSLGNALLSFADIPVINQAQESVSEYLTWNTLAADTTEADNGIVYSGTSGWGNISKAGQLLSAGQSVSVNVGSSITTRALILSKYDSLPSYTFGDYRFVTNEAGQIFAYEGTALKFTESYAENKYIRMRLDEDNVFFEISSDGVDWSMFWESESSPSGGYYVYADMNTSGALFTEMEKSYVNAATLQIEEIYTNTIGDSIGIRFNLPIGDPSSNASAFVFDFGGTAITGTTIQQSETSNYVLEILDLNTPVTSGMGNGTMAYTAGTIESYEGDVLASSSGNVVANEIRGTSQTWQNIAAEIVEYRNGIQRTTGSGYDGTAVSVAQLSLGESIEFKLAETTDLLALGLTKTTSITSYTGMDFCLLRGVGGNTYLYGNASLGSAYGQIYDTDYFKLEIDGSGNVSLYKSYDEGATFELIATHGTLASGSYYIGMVCNTINSTVYDIITI